MAGGPTTVELVVAAAEAGALGFLAGGYKTAAGLAEEMAAVRAAGVDAFGVNVFVPGQPTADPGRLAAYVASLDAEAAALGATLGAPSWDDDDYAAKVEALVAGPPAVVSFTFGVPDAEVVRALQAAGSLVLLDGDDARGGGARRCGWGRTRCASRARRRGRTGAAWRNDDRPDQDRPVRALLAAVRRRTLGPAGRGGRRGRARRRRRPAGPGRGPGPGRDGVPALPRERRAAGLQGRAGRPGVRPDGGHPGLQRTAGPGAGQRHGAGPPGAPAAYPEINNATRPLRAAAARAGDVQHMSLYAGVAFRRAEARPAGEVVERLVSGLRR